MTTYVLSFEDYIKENYNEQTNEFFSFKRDVSPVQEELDAFLDIITNLDIKFDNIYETSEKAAKKVTTVDELIHIASNVIEELNQISFLGTSDAAVKQNLSDFIESNKHKAVVLTVNS